MKRHVLYLVLSVLFTMPAWSQESLSHEITEIYDRFQDTYNESLKTEYSYYPDGNLKTSTFYAKISDDWIMGSKNDYSYNSDGHLTETTYQTWDALQGLFVNQYRSLFTYDNQKLIEEIAYRWQGNQWLQMDKTDYEFNGNQLVQLNYFEWDGTVWTNDERAFITYENNILSEITYDEFEAGTWVPTEKLIFIKNESENSEEFIGQEWNGIAWENDYKETYLLDANNNRLAEIYYESYDGTTWEESFSYEYTYDTSKLLSAYHTPFQDDLGDYQPGIANRPFYNKVLTRLESISDDDVQYQHRSQAKTIYGKTTYYYTDDVLGINDLNPSNLFTVYPNPTKNRVTIKLNRPLKANAHLFDLNGRLILEQRLNNLNTTLNINTFKTGVYVLKIQTDQGKLIKRITKN